VCLVAVFENDHGQGSSGVIRREGPDGGGPGDVAATTAALIPGRGPGSPRAAGGATDFAPIESAAADWCDTGAFGDRSSCRRVTPPSCAQPPGSLAHARQRFWLADLVRTSDGIGTSSARTRGTFHARRAERRPRPGRDLHLAGTIDGGGCYDTRRRRRKPGLPEYVTHGSASWCRSRTRPRYARVQFGLVSYSPGCVRGLRDGEFDDRARQRGPRPPDLGLAC